MPAPTPSGEQVSQLIIKNKLSPDQATLQVLGPINAALPQGAKIVNQATNYIEYVDAQGYTHKLTRNGDANSPDFGRISDDTSRPDVLPLTEQFPGLEGALQNAINSVNQSLTSGGLRPLSESDLGLLQQISDSEKAQLNQQSQRTQGELITSLYGSGTNQSTIANQAAADFAQALGIALGQQQSNAANRQLGLQQFLTENVNATARDVLGSLTGQETQRSTASSQIGLGRDQLEQQGTDAARNFLLEWEKFQASQRKSPLGGILSAIASLATAIPGVGPFIGAGLGALGSGLNSTKGQSQGLSGGYLTGG